jgi:hypothetical protein
VGVVEGMGGGDVDHVDPGVGHQLLVGADGPVHPVGLGEGLGRGQGPGADQGGPVAVQPLQIVNEPVGDPAGSQDSPPKGL